MCIIHIQYSSKMQIPASIVPESTSSIFEVILHEYSSRCFEIEEESIKSEDEYAEIPCKTCKIQTEERPDKTQQCWSKIHEQPEENFSEVREQIIVDDLLLKIQKVQLLRAEQEAKLNDLIRSQRSLTIQRPNNQDNTAKTSHSESKSLSPRKTKKIQKANPSHNLERN